MRLSEIENPFSANSLQPHPFIFQFFLRLKLKAFVRQFTLRKKMTKRWVCHIYIF